MKIALAAKALVVVALLAGLATAAQPLTLASPFTDHAVLQRDMPVPVWGKAEPGREVTVQFAGQEKKATADKDGRWTVKLDPLKGSAEGQTLTVKTNADDPAISRGDVLVGEVWVCSGQSNMAWGLDAAFYGPESISAAGDPGLRLFKAGAHATDDPQESIGGAWQVDSPQSSPGFSAVAYFFGLELRHDLKVPVGLIESAVGGTLAEAWTPREDLDMNPRLRGMLESQAAQVANYPKVLEEYKQREPELLKKWEEDAAKAKADGKPEPGKPRPPQDPSTNGNRPTGLYNGSIAPLVPYAIRGAIWYQGESNNGRAKEYETLFPAMIGAWRRVWGEGDFPFFFVQIAPFQGMSPEIREAQRLTTETTQNTAMAVTIDVGDAFDIHPRAKQPVGVRLSLDARARAYGEPIEYSGPTLDGVTFDGNRAILTFKHLGGGLLSLGGGDLRGFTIPGADGKFEPAKAKIEGDTVVVTSDAVAAPALVRYGWANVADGNLFNKAGLPASPFQTERAFELEPGFELLFNGKDLSGWHYDGAAFDGKTDSSDGRYTARDGWIVVNPGQGLAQLRTVREFPHDFHLKLQFRAGVNADSGIFIRGTQLQCRDYLVAGPYKELKNYKPQDWNDIEVIVKGDTATATCNGEPLQFDSKLSPTGPIGLEADRGQMEYRRIRIKEER